MNKIIFKKGYIALGIVSAISLAMLIVALGIGQQSIMTRENIEQYETWRASEILLFSCISIIREKIISNEFFLPVADDIFWQLRNGVCELEVTNETSESFEFRIGERRIEVEKDMGMVLRID